MNVVAGNDGNIDEESISTVDHQHIYITNCICLSIKCLRKKSWKDLQRKYQIYCWVTSYFIKYWCQINNLYFENTYIFDELNFQKSF